MPKIALISDHASPLAELGSVDAGGQNVYVAQIAAELGRRGYLVDVFTRRDGTDRPSAVQWRENVRVIHVPAGPPRFVAKEKLLPYIDEFGDFVVRFFCAQAMPYDLVHANFFMSGMVAMQLKRVLNVPFALTFHALGLVRRQHQGASDGFDDSRFEIEAQLMDEADAIVAECEQDERDMVELYRALPGKIECVPCGFDPKEFSPDPRARARFGLEADEFVVLQLGRMVARKGVDNVIRAIAAMKRRYGVRARLLVVGGNSQQPDVELTPELGRLMRVASDEGVAEQVVFTGSRARSALRGFYSTANVFVTTPWYEPFGITPLEAMACARPVIGADVGGLKSTIVPDKTGFLVPPNDPQALAERLVVLQRDPALARRMGRAGRRRAVTQYTWGSVVDQLARVYDGIVAASVRSGRHTEWQTSPLPEPACPPAASTYATGNA